MHRLVNAVMGELLVGTTPMSGVVVSQQAFSYHHLMCCCVSTVLLLLHSFCCFITLHLQRLSTHTNMFLFLDLMILVLFEMHILLQEFASFLVVIVLNTQGNSLFKLAVASIYHLYVQPCQYTFWNNTYY